MKFFIFIASIFVTFFNSNIIAQPVLSLTPVISTGLNTPMQLVNAGDSSNRIFIVQKGGTILIYDKEYTLLGTFVTVTAVLNSGEEGLLSMAFHPDYKHNGFFYVYYVTTGGNLQLARYHVSANENVADASSKVILKTIPHPTNANHNGGELHFGNDGYLYLSTGDGGGGGDLPNNAQTTTVLLGKILRFAVDTTQTAPYYSIPADNPFGNEVYAYGLRNPFRWSFDRDTHDMWIGDVGQDAWEEIDFRQADSTKGTNFGWHCYEGKVSYNTSGTCASPGYCVFPVYVYPTQNPSASVVGGTVYRGPTYLDLQGYYIGADYYSGIFYKISHDILSGIFTTSTQTLSPAGLSDFGETEDGELYAVSLTANAVYRIVANGRINYVFNGNGNWDDANNWSNKTIPPASLPSGSVITVDPVENGECVLNVPQTILTGAKIMVQPDKQFRVVGDLTIQ